MARVLMVSKFKKFQGGVERHIYDLMNGLQARGHSVRLFSSEDVEAEGGVVFSAADAHQSKIQSARLLLWNQRARSELRKVIDEFRPDLIHFHSISHQLSPSVLGVFAGPQVMTMHDYKLSAPCYTLVRNDDVCQDCVGKKLAVPAMRYRCISGSLAGSAICCAESVVHKRRFDKKIDRFIVPSLFASDVAVRGGLPADRISVVPWGVTNKLNDGQAEFIDRRTAFYGGRFHRTKGAELLLKAWQMLPSGHGCELRIAGEGELEAYVLETAARDQSVTYLGMLSGSDVATEISRASLVMMPSLAPETMGLAALEALVVGTPVLLSGRGALGDLRGPGVAMMGSVDATSLRDCLVDLLVNGGVKKLRDELRARDLTAYTAARMIDDIVNVYNQAMRQKPGRAQR